MVRGVVLGGGGGQILISIHSGTDFETIENNTGLCSSFLHAAGYYFRYGHILYSPLLLHSALSHSESLRCLCCLSLSPALAPTFSLFSLSGYLSFSLTLFPSFSHSRYKTVSMCFSASISLPFFLYQYVCLSLFIHVLFFFCVIFLFFLSLFHPYRPYLSFFATTSPNLYIYLHLFFLSL
jgi:hypothetical protein